MSYRIAEYELEVGKEYELLDTLGMALSHGVYIGQVELFEKLRASSNPPLYSSKYDKEMLLFDLGERPNRYRYALVRPSIRLHDNKISVILRVNQYSQDYKTAPMDDVMLQEYRLKEDKNVS